MRVACGHIAVFVLDTMAKASAPLFDRLNQAIQSGEADDVIKTLKVTVFSLSHDMYVNSIHDEARGFWHWK